MVVQSASYTDDPKNTLNAAARGRAVPDRTNHISLFVVSAGNDRCCSDFERYAPARRNHPYAQCRIRCTNVLVIIRFLDSLVSILVL
jgi:hypothetical protein